MAAGGVGAGTQVLRLLAVPINVRLLQALAVGARSAAILRYH